MNTNIDIEEKIIDKFFSDVEKEFEISGENVAKIRDIFKQAEIDFGQLIEQLEK